MLKFKALVALVVLVAAASQLEEPAGLPHSTWRSDLDLDMRSISIFAVAAALLQVTANMSHSASSFKSRLFWCCWPCWQYSLNCYATS